MRVRALVGRTCDTSDWPNKDRECGICTVLVGDFTCAYGNSCEKFCYSIGRECAGAAEENEDSCVEESKQGCSAAAWTSGGTSDALCECGDRLPPPRPPPDPTPICACTLAPQDGVCSNVDEDGNVRAAANADCNDDGTDDNGAPCTRARCCEWTSTEYLQITSVEYACSKLIVSQRHSPFTQPTSNCTTFAPDPMASEFKCPGHSMACTMSVSEEQTYEGTETYEGAPWREGGFIESVATCRCMTDAEVTQAWIDFIMHYVYRLVGVIVLIWSCKTPARRKVLWEVFKWVLQCCCCCGGKKGGESLTSG